MIGMEKLRVIKIISPYKLVLNGGENAGLQRNDRVVVFGLSTEVLTDPDTGEELEKLEILRGRGKVIHLQEKICTIETIETNKEGKRVIKSFGGFQSIMSPKEEIVYDDTLLPFDEPQIGDYVRIDK